MSRWDAVRSVGFIAVLVIAALVGVAVAEATPVEQARALLAAWHEDPARVDRARAMLEAEAADRPSAEGLVELSNAWFITGDFRRRSDAERQAAYAEGAQAARRAIALAPRDERAHLLLAFNTGRSAEITGVTRAIGLLGTIREESSTVLRLNPSNVDGLILAGGLAAGLPALMGGDRKRAEAYFIQALELDPHRSGGRLELARLYVAERRWGEAARELQAIMDDGAPTDLPRWTMSDLPRARLMLFELRQSGRVPGIPPQSP